MILRDIPRIDKGGSKPLRVKRRVPARKNAGFPNEQRQRRLSDDLDRATAWASQAIVGVPVTCQAARIRRFPVSNRASAVRGNYIDIEVHHPLARNHRILRAHSMGSVADGTRESGIDVARMLAKADVTDYACQVVTLGTKGIVSRRSQIRRSIQICDRLPRNRRLTDVVPSLKKMRISRTMRPVWPSSA